MMKRKKIPHFYIALVLIVIITVTTFGTMKMEEDLDNEKYLVKETFNAEGSEGKISIIPKPISIETNEGRFILTILGVDNILYPSIPSSGFVLIVVK